MTLHCKHYDINKDKCKRLRGECVPGRRRLCSANVLCLDTAGKKSQGNKVNNRFLGGHIFISLEKILPSFKNPAAGRGGSAQEREMNINIIYNLRFIALVWPHNPACDLEEPPLKLDGG